jgi:hypothetical protein
MKNKLGFDENDYEKGELKQSAKDRFRKENEMLLQVMMADPNQILWVQQMIKHFNITFEEFRIKVEDYFESKEKMN